jgi:hypothetical protein
MYFSKSMTIIRITTKNNFQLKTSNIIYLINIKSIYDQSISLRSDFVECSSQLFTLQIYYEIVLNVIPIIYIKSNHWAFYLFNNYNVMICEGEISS